MEETSDSPIDTHDEWVESAQTLLCLACADPFEAPINRPRLRCPSCSAIGYPDKAGRNLVSVGWDCLQCGAWNTGRTNFCMQCSAGLTSRCLKCEYPVYTSICQRCGSHQDALLRLKIIEADRASWMPIQRSYLEAQQRVEAAKQAKREKRNTQKPSLQDTPPDVQSVAQSPVKDWLEVNQQPQPQPISQPLRRVFRPKRLAMLWLIAAMTSFFWLFRAQIPVWTEAAANSSAGTAILTTVAQWWLMAQALATSPSTVKMGSTEYAVFFAITLFGIAAAPVLIYVLGRTIRGIIR